MKFFERQEDARRRTTRLRIAFALTVLVVVLALDAVVVIALGGSVHGLWRVIGKNPLVFLAMSAVVALPILIASRRKWRELQEGGTAIARALGALPVTPANRDPASARLRNVVEEMAVAARMKVPALFVLREEHGINAFAAGLTTDDAAVVVTQGALDALDRAELQAVIGHEFSHVLNGDMAMNLRLTAWLHGLYSVTELGERIRRRKNGRSRGVRSWVVGWMVTACGLVGHAAGRVLQAAVSRSRERLADASSVQFTRDPGALQSALLKIAGTAAGSRVEADGARGVAHMFFAAGVSASSWKFADTLLATHPSIVERLQALDPSFDPRAMGRLSREAANRVAARIAAAQADTQRIDPPAGGVQAVPIANVLAIADAATHGGGANAATARSAAAVPSAQRAAAPVRSAPVSPVQSPTAGGARPTAEARPHAPRSGAPTSSAAPVPFPAPASADGTSVRALEALRQSSQTEGQACALALAAAVASEPARRHRHLKAIAATFGPKLALETQRHATCLDGAVPRGRFLAMQKALDGVRALPDAERDRLLRAVTRLAADDPSPSLFQACFTTLVAARCRAAPEPTETLRDALPRLAAFLALLARAGSADERAQQRAYRAALVALVPGGAGPAYAPVHDWRATLAAALDTIARLHPGARRPFRDALGAAVLADGRVTAEESDLVRTACVLMDVAPPNFGQASSLAAPPAASGTG